MGPLRVGFPIAVGGTLLSIASLLLGEFVIPVSSERMHFVEDVLIERKTDEKLLQGAKWFREENRLYTFKEYDPVDKRMTGVRIIHTGANFRATEIMESRFGKFQPETKDWKLTEVKVLYFRPNGTLAFSEIRDQESVRIPVEEQRLRQERRNPNELSLKELREMVQRGQSTGVDVGKYAIDMHVKFAFHFASFVVCLIGLKFGYRSERVMETARSIFLAIAIGMSYWFILNAGKALGARGAIPPVIGAWIANVVIFATAFVMIWRSRRA